ncbi:MAG: decaheme c-type cytochrome, OmcA/MtrC family, partial [Bacteroidetes bacterium]|nr:decaheme c-type cytochrome, OmcA/MtrC family [Bacteroidota bacterium]
HYGTVGAIFAGQGGIQFTGSVPYANSGHTTEATCSDCHMASITGRAGGHTFRMRSGEGALTSSTSWNFNGCNVSGCHTGYSSSDELHWKTPRKAISDLLNALAQKINTVGGGTDILHSEPDGEENLWAGLTTGNYDGYLNIYDPSSNPTGVWKNPGSTSSWTTEQKNTNNSLPVFPSLKNVVVGAMINFQLCLREYSLGIHNFKYSKALLQNSIDALTAAGL